MTAIDGFELVVNPGAAYELASPGSHPARFVGLVNGGTHPTPGVNGAPGVPQPKYMFIIELPFEQRPDGRPFVILYECTASLSPKANLRKLVQDVLGKQLADGERFMVTEFLGKPCSVAISHESKADRVFFKISSVGPAIKAMIIPEQHYPRLVWSISSGEPFPAVDWLPCHFGRSVADWVAESQEARAAAQQAARETTHIAASAVVTGDDIAY